jgi:hypothetical protein
LLCEYLGNRRPLPRPFPLPRSLQRFDVKNCTLCKFSKVCNDLPGICIIIPYVAIAVVVLAVGYLFVTQEILV